MSERKTAAAARTKTTAEPAVGDARAQVVALYEKAIARIDGLSRKGAQNPYTSHNGHMFSFITKENTLAFRLPQPARAAFEKKHGTGPVIQYGAVMREYVSLPAPLLSRTQTVARYLAESFAYIDTLEPKPTTRKSPAKKATAKKATAKKSASKVAAPKKKAR